MVLVSDDNGLMFPTRVLPDDGLNLNHVGAGGVDYRKSRLFKLFLYLVGLILRRAFLDRLRSGFYEFFRLFETERRDRTDILGVPQLGLSFDICRINFRSSRSIFGRPARLFQDFQRQYSLNPSLCQRITVSGCTMINEDFHPPQIFDSQTQKIRSRFRSFGRLAVLL